MSVCVVSRLFCCHSDRSAALSTVPLSVFLSVSLSVCLSVRLSTLLCVSIECILRFKRNFVVYGCKQRDYIKCLCFRLYDCTPRAATATATTTPWQRRHRLCHDSRRCREATATAAEAALVMAAVPTEKDRKTSHNNNTAHTHSSGSDCVFVRSESRPQLVACAVCIS